METIILLTFIHLSMCLFESTLDSARIQYSREFLLQCYKPNSGKQVADHVFPAPGSFSPFKQKKNRSGRNGSTVKTRKRGRKGGVRQRLKKISLLKIPLPTIKFGERAISPEKDG